MSQFRRTLLATGLSLAFLPFSVNAEEDHEHREHGAHEHGAAQLNLAVVGSEVEVELETPAANIVGFEHMPSSEADHHALDEAVVVLKKGESLFRFNGEAGCHLTKAEVASPLLEKEEHHGHDDEHEAHEETHSEFHAHYHFNCTQPARLNQLQVDLFDRFPATHHLNVQYIVNDTQGAVELEADHRKITF